VFNRARDNEAGWYLTPCGIRKKERKKVRRTVEDTCEDEVLQDK
jgi:hypothetical protein